MYKTINQDCIYSNDNNYPDFFLVWLYKKHWCPLVYLFFIRKASLEGFFLPSSSYSKVQC